MNVATIDTDGAFAVSASGVTDSFGNAFSGTIDLTDAANPVLVSVTTTRPDAGSDMRKLGDILSFNFSEPVRRRTRERTLVLTNDGANDTTLCSRLPAPASTTGGDYNSPNGGGDLDVRGDPADRRQPGEPDPRCVHSATATALEHRERQPDAGAGLRPAVVGSGHARWSAPLSSPFRAALLGDPDAQVPCSTTR